MFIFSSACFFDEIITAPENVPDTLCLIVLIFFIKFISAAIAIFLVKRISSCFPSLLLLRVQSVLSIGCFIGYTDPSFFLNIISNIFLTRFSSDRVSNLTLNFLYLEYNIIFIFLRLASANNIFIKMFFYIPIITRAFLLITLYIIFCSVFQLFYQIFTSNNIVVYTTVTWILRISLKASPYFLIISYILAVAFLIFSIF